MKLLYDLYCLYSGSSPVHGGGVYGVSFFNQAMPRLRAMLGDKLEAAACVPRRLRLDPRIEATMASCRITPLPLDSEGGIRELVDSDEYDLYYSAMPYTLPRIFRQGRSGHRTRISGTVHGVRDLEIRYDGFFCSYMTEPYDWIKHCAVGLIDERRKERRWKRFSTLFSLMEDRILTVSNHTKYRILSEFPRIRTADISVVYSLEEEHPVPELDAPGIATELRRLGLEPQRYFLLIGCNRPVKNAMRVIAALDHFRVEGAEAFRFACLGFTEAQQRRIRSKYPKAAKLLVFLPYVSQESLSLLYKEAFSFVYPSLSEGFGYPPLEAMRFGVPVLASGVASIPEVCGDVALYFNPYDLAEIATRLATIIAEKGLRERLSAQGPARYQAFRSLREEQLDGFIAYLING
jgi:glycosyltransferase involved in cell wall biosynthesis